MRKLILGCALAWGTFALLSEGHRVRSEVEARGENRAAVPYWHFGTPQVERLDRCLTLVRDRVPPGHVVVFASPPDALPGRLHEFFRWRWAAYLLPRYDVAPLQSPETGRLAEYLVTYHRTLENPRLELMAELPDCELYQVRQAKP